MVPCSYKSKRVNYKGKIVSNHLSLSVKTHTKSIVIKKESEYYFDLGALRYNVYGCIFVSIRRLIHVKIY